MPSIIEAWMDSNLLSVLVTDFLRTIDWGQSYEEKVAGIQNDAIAKTPNTGLEHTVTAARLLEELSTETRIKKWCYVPANSFLDDVIVDFLIVANDDWAVPLQVTSTPKKGQKHRQRASQLYGQQSDIKPTIVVVQLLEGKGRPVDEHLIKNNIMEGVNDAQGIKWRR